MRIVDKVHNLEQQYSANLNYSDETTKTWIFKPVFLKLGSN